MSESKAGLENSKEALVLILMFLFVISAGIFGYILLQKKSVNNKHICAYLGGLWMRKDNDPEHRCYTYEEFYR